ncbi:MAG TPA: hypothetical protein VGO56_02885 [Pyrinomonadaceae bacterium]|jgi:hypothetical protein|nr:hypothetical protein [Pyrinomonadaceae bacterium]
MFLKIATIIAIVGVGLSALLSIIQQAVFAARFYGDGIMLLTRLISVFDLVLLNGSLLVFFVAFLLNLRAKRVNGAPSPQ